MVEQWIRNTFAVLSGGWESSDGVQADAFEFQGARSLTRAPIDWFVATFGSVSVPPTAASLKACDPEDRLGWHRHFDAWVEQGIIQP